MGQVLVRALSLLRRPAVLVAFLLVAGGGTALIWLPLFGLPGFELSAALALGVGLLGGVWGIAAGFQERRLIRGVDPRPRRAVRFDSATRSTAHATGAAFLLSLAALAVPFLASVVFAFTSTRCNPFAAIGFFPLLTLPSALAAAAAGVLCGLAGQRAWSAGLWYLALVAASAAVSFWPVLFGPQVYLFNHFGGYWPGPLYDEALAVRPPLYWFRLETVLVSAFLWFLGAFLLDMKTGSLSRPYFRPGAALLLVSLGLAIGWMEQTAPSLGIRITDRALQAKLGGKRETKHFDLYFPRGKAKEDIDRLERDLEFRHHQLRAFFGEAPTERLRVYLYRTPDEKLQLVGASRTQFAKPWRLELHINDARYPHPILKHELAHLMSAPFGSGPFRLTSTFGLFPQMGIVEGMAVAADNPNDELTLHEWSAAMRAQGLMPDIRALLGPTGFYRAAASRAYTAVGSFLRYLADTHGPDKLKVLYAHGDFSLAYGRSLDSLAAEWEKFLDTVPLDPEAVNFAFSRFRRGSLFSRPCAREVARLHQLAGETLPSDPERALGLYQRCAELQPEEPSFALGVSQALSKIDRRGEAAEVLSGLAARLKEQPATLGEVAMAQADLAFLRQRFDEARRFLEQVLKTQPQPAIERTARVKLAGLDAGLESSAARAIWGYFQTGPEEVKVLLLEQALATTPRDGVLHYLLGRRLWQSKAPTFAFEPLKEATHAALPDALKREALRLRFETAFLVGDCDDVRHQFGQLPSYGAAYRAEVAEWVERCAFEAETFGALLRPELK